MTIDLSTIEQQIIECGIAKGDIVLLHSSLKSIGFVKGGADTVIDAFLNVLGTAGTLLMPSFQAGSEFFLVEKGCRFDIRNSPSEVGTITECFRKRPGVMRSLSPTHCVAGIGARAKEILSDHEKCVIACGNGSPFHKICDLNGKIFLLGVSHESNTTLHFLENTNGAPTICHIKYRPVVIDKRGREIIVPTFSHMPGLPRNYPRVEPHLLKFKIQKNGKIGNANCKIIKAREMALLVGGMIHQNPLFLIANQNVISAIKRIH